MNCGGSQRQKLETPNRAYAVPAPRSFSPRHCDRFSRDWSVLGARIGLRGLQDDDERVGSATNEGLGEEAG
jgi:hypothetical protein